MKIIAPALVALSVLATPVMAGQGKLGVKMPTPSNGIAGCWNSDRNLYGKYSLRFCINEQGSGSYTVSGRGLNCHARLDGQPDLDRIQLHHGPCPLRPRHGLDG